ncbi:type II toxin-antitoxin system HicB family antitoxin [Rubrivirga sp. IMCC45206]|uniref:type II toxin-antitoxin system HicB family antitoxin n=1 Tax=Rubrivirga sp. IMCC45206 TaxID=3391614 RepID=UPI0039902712
MPDPDLRYEVIVYWSDADGAYLAEVPELPGCLSDGDTHAEAGASAEDAMRAWIETARELGREVPVLKGRRLHFA